jgi:hypothetical protein
MKLGAGHLRAHLAERQQREVQSLVPVQAPGKQDDRTPVPAPAKARLEETGVGMIEEYRTTARRARACRVGIPPKMIRDDHVIRHCGGPAFEQTQDEPSRPSPSAAELGRVELGREVMDIEENPGAAPPRACGRQHEEVGHVMHVHEVEGSARIFLAQPTRAPAQET